MTTKDVRNKFDIELNSKSDGAYDIFVTEEKDEFISFGIRQFYARRLSGLTSDRTSFEQWQKRSDDLRCVYTKHEASVSQSGTRNDAKWYAYDIPSDYWHMLSEDVDVLESSVVNNVTLSATIGTFDVFECTTDNFTSRLNDSLGEHIYYKNKLRPLRLYNFNRPSDDLLGSTFLQVSPETTNDIEILEVELGIDLDMTTEEKSINMKSILYFKAPSNISLGKYTIEYIRKPNEFGIYSNEYKNGIFVDTNDIMQVPDYAWDEVLSIAVKHALENTSSYRLQTYNSERLEIQ